MKHRWLSRSGASWRLLSIVSAVLLMHNHAMVAYTLSFDSPFPASPYKTVLDLCMHTCGDLDALTTNQVSEETRPLLTDALVGRSVRLQSAVTGLVQHHTKVNALEPDDGAYLMSVFEHMQRQYHDILNEQQYAGVHDILRSIEKQMHSLVEL